MGDLLSKMEEYAVGYVKTHPINYTIFYSKIQTFLSEEVVKA